MGRLIMEAGGEGGEGEGAQISPYSAPTKALFAAYWGSLPLPPSPHDLRFPPSTAKTHCLGGKYQETSVDFEGGSFWWGDV